jgi:hypothetical protein
MLSIDSGVEIVGVEQPAIRSDGDCSPRSRLGEREHGGNVAATAGHFGIARSTFYRARPRAAAERERREFNKFKRLAATEAAFEARAASGVLDQDPVGAAGGP